MENIIRNYAERIHEYKTQKTKAIQVKYLLEKEFDILRLTSQKREILNQLFKRYNLILNVAYSNQRTDWLSVDTDKLITVGITHESHKTFDDISEIEQETIARQTFSVVQGSNNFKWHPHQIEAIKSLNGFYQRGKNRKGVLVLPTGGGKTVTAVRWLLQNVINENKKVIWIAHRHELLEQAKDTIHRNCYSDLLSKRDKITIHLISGYETHHQPRKINRDDDIIIASKDSLRMGRDFLISNFLKYNKDVFLVIDEAHHAVAKTYSELINIIESHSTIGYNLLGLTATPFRTAEKEQTYLSKVFTDGIIYSTDLNKLVIDKILAKPIFEQIETGEMVKKDEDFTEKDLKLINSTLELPESIKTNLATRKTRNNVIVETYNKKKYGKTLIFALNKDHAVAIDTLLRDRGFRSKFIISGLQNQIGINKSNKDNKQTIDEFRRNEIDILVNVNILTEGTDLPDANSVFLTRPTNSKILMTQMIGRVLRGPKAGGTETAQIVSFIDNWDNLVSWVSPKELLSDESQIIYGDKERGKLSLQIISLKLLQQFILLLDRSIDSSELKALPAIQRIPVGWYSFQIEVQTTGDESDSRIFKVLVFENHFLAFKYLENEMEELYLMVDVDKNNSLDHHEKVFLLSKIKTRFFESCSPIPVVNDDDLMNFIEFYDQTRQIPPYFTFEQREEVNISKLVDDIEVLNKIQRRKIVEKAWGESREISIWRELFNDNFDYFINEINIEENKRDFGQFVKSVQLAPIEFEKEKLKNIPLHQWPEPYQAQMRDAVFEKSKDKNGFFICAITGEKSKSRAFFHIDHIVPFSKEKNNTVLKNLRVIKNTENWKKGDKY
jgi:superfamily II DNA or RNA helicase